MTIKEKTFCTKRLFFFTDIYDEKIWLKMLKDSNLTSHTYNKDLANEIYDHTKTYCLILEKTVDNIFVVMPFLL